jgi:hypothetical protein
VVAAPGAAGVLPHGDVLGKVALAFVAFCLVSSATYLPERRPRPRVGPPALSLPNPRPRRA